MQTDPGHHAMEGPKTRAMRAFNERKGGSSEPRVSHIYWFSIYGKLASYCASTNRLYIADGPDGSVDMAYKYEGLEVWQLYTQG